MIEIEIGGYSRPFPGEFYNGDAFFIREEPTYKIFALIDGLGHGYSAYLITHEILRFLEYFVEPDPKELMIKINKAMIGTIGAVMGIGMIREDHFYYSSLGNIDCTVYGNTKTKMIMMDGILGKRERSVQLTKHRLHPGDMIILHSDGVRKLEDFKYRNKLHLYSSELLAKMIVEEMGNDYDDATALVLKVQNET